jgi:Mrp family chromosome partitioning ATPase
MWKWIETQSRRLSEAWDRPDGGSASRISEAYRTCLYRIHEKTSKEGKKVFSISSPRRGDGRTSFAILLGLTAASLTQQKVALIDADFLRPCLHTALDLDIAPGLSEGLATGWAEASLSLQASPFPGLDVMTAGQGLFKRQFLLEREEAKGLLRHLRASYGMILVDTPAVLDAGGLVTLAGEVEGTIILVRRRANRIKELEQVKSLAEESSLGIIGAVHYQAH